MLAAFEITACCYQSERHLTDCFAVFAALKLNLHLRRAPQLIHESLQVCGLPSLCPLLLLCHPISSSVVGLLAPTSPCHTLQKPQSQFYNSGSKSEWIQSHFTGCIRRLQQLQDMKETFRMQINTGYLTSAQSMIGYPPALFSNDQEC